MTTQVDVINVAQSLLGQHENPIGSNNTTFGAELGLTPAQWCAQFVSHVLRQAGYQFPNDTQHPGKGFSSVGFFQNWARKHGYITDSPAPGDLVCFEWEHDSWPDHIGFYSSKVDTNSFVTIEGNAKGPDGYDEVAYHTRVKSEVSSFIHLPIDHADTPVDVQVPPVQPRSITPYPRLTTGVLLGRKYAQHHDFNAILQRQLQRRGWKISVDGIYGPETERVITAFQKEKHLQVDGVVGPQTWKAVFELPVT